MNRKHKKIASLFLSFTLLSNLLNCLNVFAEEDLQNNKIKLQATLTPPYVIGPGDVLSITDRTLRELFGQVETYNLTVSADGFISIPLPDGTQENVLVAGSTLDETSAIIREFFGRTLKNPLVFVQISKYRPVNVYIGGAVVKPGVYKIETTSTTEKGATTTSTATFGLTLTEALQLAGGIRPRANVKSLVVTRGTNSEKITINLISLLLGDPNSQDINMQPGDAIFVPTSETTDEQAQTHVTLLGKLAYQEVPVNVVGEVKTPGSFTLANDSTLLDAIGNAGGLNVVGSLKKIRLSRYDTDGIYKTFHIDVHDLIHKGVSFDQIALRPNDTIEFEASKGKETRHFFREIASNTIAVLTGTVAGTFGNFLVQDSFLNRQARISRSNLNFPNLPLNNAITVIGGSRSAE